MGLDQWLTAKTNKKITEENNHTGVCSGLFGIVPKAVADNFEIGYWRKAYDQGQLIEDLCNGDHLPGENYNMIISKDDVDNILKEARRILNEHSFDPEDGNDLTEDDPKFQSEEYTWKSKDKWKDTITFFERAKAIYEEDPEAQIIYHFWF